MKTSFLESQVLKKNIFISNFFTGILSTLLATPCTAPLVGTAISFALSQSYFLSIIIFLLMGIGKSMPYVIFIIKPSILWHLPRPGAWTKYIKAFIGLLLIFSLIWLSSLLIKHYSNFNGSNYLLNNKGSNWEEFNKDKLFNYTNNNTKVFIDVTAEWCLNCKLNKKLVLESQEVLDLFDKNNIKLIRADWTFPDQEIFEFLKKYNKYGIPFNIFFSDNYPEGYIFGEILNKSQLMKILSE
jgi:suppressor for copper-sensitivity B